MQVTVRFIPTLYVSTDTPNSITMTADKDDRIDSIKQKLQYYLGVGATRIRLLNGETGEILQDGRSLRDHGIITVCHLPLVSAFRSIVPRVSTHDGEWETLLHLAKIYFDQ
jgi:hypothetical protein